jgi:hypothetical protein
MNSRVIQWFFPSLIRIKRTLLKSSPKRGTFFSCFRSSKDHFQNGNSQYFRLASLLFHSHNSTNVYSPLMFTHRIHTTNHSSIQFFFQFTLIHIVLVLAYANGGQFYQLSQRITQSATDRNEPRTVTS